MPAPHAPALVTRWASLLDISGHSDEVPWSEVFDELRRPIPYAGDKSHPGWSPIRCVPPLRADKNVQAISALTLDYDGTASIQGALELWGHLYGLLHTTRKHTEDVHRFRIVLPLSRYVTPAEHARLWAWANDRAERAGHRLDGATKDAARFWYLPGGPDGVPFSAVELQGEALDVDAVLAAWDAKERTNQRHPPGGIPSASVPLTDKLRRARSYLGKMPHAVSGQAGHLATWRAAVVLVRGFDLPPNVALDLLTHEYNPRCIPPWSLRELEHKVASADRDGRIPRGYILDDESRDPWPQVGVPPPAATGEDSSYNDEERAGLEDDALHPQDKPAEPPGFKFLSLDELLAPLEPVNYLVEAFDMCPGRPTQIAGTGFAGKTICAQSMLLSVMADAPVWGQFRCRKGPVVHLDYEMGRRATLNRYRRLCIGMGLRWEEIAMWLRLAPLPRLYLNSEKVEDHFKRATEGAALVLIDSLRRSLPGEEENDSGITEYIDILPRVSEATGCCFLFVHHSTTKSKSLEGQDERGAGRGSSAIYDASGAVLSLVGKIGEPVTVKQTKAPERGTPCEPFRLSIEDVAKGDDPRAGVCVRYLSNDADGGDAPDEAKLRREMEAKVVAAVRAHAGCSGRSLRSYVKGRGVDIDAALERLIGNGTIANLGGRAGQQLHVQKEGQE